MEKKPALQRYITRFSMANEDADTAWIGKSTACSKSIASAISLLTSVKEMAVDGAMALGLRDVPKLLFNAILDLMAQPSVTRIELTALTMDTCPCDFTTFSSIKELVLKDVTPYVKPGRAACTQLPTPLAIDDPQRLQLLDFTACGSIIRSLIFSSLKMDVARRITSPRELWIGTIGWNEDMADGWTDLLKCSAPIVEKYTVHQDSFQPLDHPMTSPFPPEVLALTHFRELHTFTLIGVFHFFDHEAHNPVPYLLKELDTLSRTENEVKLRRLNLEFDFRRIDGEDEEDLDIRESLLGYTKKDIWAKLDEILVQPAFGKLEEVCITFEVTYCELPDKVWARAKGELLKGLKRMGTREGLSIKVEKFRQIES